MNDELPELLSCELLPKGLTGKVLDETVRHEIVHSVLTPKNRVLNAGRAWLYQNSNVWIFAEEAAAETYATRSLLTGVAFPLRGGYTTLGRLSGEAVLVGGTVGGIGYGIFGGSR